MKWVVDNIEARVEVADLIERYRDAERFLALCRECPSYGRVWSCPPHDIDRAWLQAFDYAMVYGTRIVYDPAVRAGCTTAEAREAIEREAMHEAMREVTPRLYALEREHPGSRLFTVRCRLCGDERCARERQEPCRHPQLMRHSLESVGFNVDAIAREVLHMPLQWTAGSELPEYSMLVTALFIKKHQ